MSDESTAPCRVTAGSRKNQSTDKPNEDAYWIDPDLRVYCIADGITRCRKPDGTYPDPSPAVTAADIAVSSVARLVREGPVDGEIGARIYRALTSANAAIRRYIDRGQTKDLSVVCEFPGAVASVLAFNELGAVFAHLGDCAIVKFKQGDLSNPERLTTDQTAAVAKWSAETHSISAEAKLSFARQFIRNNSEHPMAFGALDGQEAAIHFIETGRCQATAGDSFMLYSDGLSAVFEDLKTDRCLKDMLALRDVDAVFDYAEKSDNHSGRRSDDKTLILIDLLA